MNKEIRRLFIAIDLDTKTRTRIIKQLKALHSKTKNIRWFKPENLHITLRFLGNTPNESIPDLINTLDKILKPISPFSISIHGPVLFPFTQHPSVVALPLLANNHLQQLVETVETVATQFDFKPEKRPYHGHISIGKIDKDHRPKLPAVKWETLEMKVKDIVLYQSDTLPEGVVYTALKRFQLLLR